jgi:acetyl/propionyl-CoA carboxylase alpha subunit
MIRRVLIANRGEIARRVIRTCREMSIATVAIYSDADADALHVHEADAAERVGPAAASESYLRIPAVIDAARRARADAVHPGYGFLSENAEFAQACADAGLAFIGPPAAVIRRMGSKTASRETVSAAGVPVVPGATPASQSAADISRAVRDTGLPVLLKAAAGGGGKGMRIVRREDEIEDAVAAAASEGVRAFGDGALYVERLVERPRHIEVQIFGDTLGQVVHLFERDCSLQRRHQKVIEEAPAPRLAPGVRARLLEAAVRAARAVSYSVYRPDLYDAALAAVGLARDVEVVLDRRVGERRGPGRQTQDDADLNDRRRLLIEEQLRVDGWALVSGEARTSAAGR